MYERGFSQEDTYQKIYPVWTYSALSIGAIVALTVDQLPHYKYLVVLEGLAYLLTRFLVIFGRSVFSQQVMQFAYAIATSTEVGYTSYAYFTMRRSRFHFATGCIRAAKLLGTFSSAGVAQIIISLAYEDEKKNVPYMTLNWISFVAVASALFVSLMLPKNSDPNTWNFLAYGVLQAFHKVGCCRTASQTRDYSFLDDDDSEQLENEDVHTQLLMADDACVSQAGNINTGSMERRHPGIMAKAKQAYTSVVEFLRKPSHQEMAIIYSFSLASLYQAQNYSQNLWDDVNHGSSAWNGAVTAVATISAAASSYGVTSTKNGFFLTRKDFMMIFTALAGLFLVLPATLHFKGNIWLAYSSWVLFRLFVAAVISISQFRIARGCSDKDKKYGTLYGICSFLGLAVASILQVAVGKNGFHLDVRVQFIVYGIFLWLFVGGLPRLLFFFRCKFRY